MKRRGRLQTIKRYEQENETNDEEDHEPLDGNSINSWPRTIRLLINIILF